MIEHHTLGSTAFGRSRQLYLHIREGKIRLGGNRSLKIYGMLDCPSGRRMKLANRVFFKDEAEALRAGYRPCGHCMRSDYKLWKESQFSG